MRHPLRPLLLIAACLLFGAYSRAEARQPYRARPPRPVYAPTRPVYPGVYVFPQINTAPGYPVFTYGSYPYTYSPGLYGGYVYNPGSYFYSYSPLWGGSYSYTYPTFPFWYRRW